MKIINENRSICKGMGEYTLERTKEVWDSAIRHHVIPLVETRGINPQIPSLCDEIWDYINSHEAYKQDNINTYIDIPIHSFFINGKININIILSDAYDSNFVLNKCYIDNDNKTIDNVIINLGLNENFEKTEFCLTLSHELMHVYNYWHIAKKPRTQKIRSYYANLQRYSNSAKKFKTTNRHIEKDVRQSLYYIFRDEINAEFQSLYDYVLRTKEINRHNYLEYIRKTRMYRIIIFLENIFNMLLNLDTMGKIVVGHVYYDYMRDNSLSEYNKDEKKSFKEYKNKLEYTINYLKNKLYRIVYYALEQAERLDESRIYKEEYMIYPLVEMSNRENLTRLINRYTKISIKDFLNELRKEYNDFHLEK